jgi:hypothetical protein
MFVEKFEACVVHAMKPGIQPSWLMLMYIRFLFDVRFLAIFPDGHHWTGETGGVVRGKNGLNQHRKYG